MFIIETSRNSLLVLCMMGTIDMKCYSIEQADNDFSKIIIYRENVDSEYPNNIVDFCAYEYNCNVQGYCHCLHNFGYVNISILKAEQQSRNFRDGLADSFGRY